MTCCRHVKNPRIWEEYARLQKERTCDRVATLEADVVIRLACEDCIAVRLIGVGR
jgi:hypothetical protein